MNRPTKNNMSKEIKTAVPVLETAATHPLVPPASAPVLDEQAPLMPNVAPQTKPQPKPAPAPAPAPPKPKPAMGESAPGFLTRREQFAKASLEGLRAANVATSYNKDGSVKDIWTQDMVAAQAIQDADALMAWLDKYPTTRK